MAIDSEKISNVVTAITNKITALITTHDTNNSAHSTLFNQKASTEHVHGNISKDGTLSGKGQNVVTDANGNITTEAKPTIPDVSNKIDTAGTGLSKSGTTLNHSNSVTADATGSFKKLKYDAQGHITGAVNVVASDLPSHTHSDYNKATYSQTVASSADGAYEIGKITVDGSETTIYGKDTNTSYTHPASHATTMITEDSALANIGTSANASQHTINDAINTKIGALASVDVLVVDTADANGKPSTTASASTVGKLYLTKATSGKDDNYNEFITTQTGSTYSWEKIGSTSIDLSDYALTSSLKAVATTGSYADLTNKPSYTATVTSSTTGAYKIGSINISGSSVDIYGKDTNTTYNVDSNINDALDALAEAIYPTSS